MGRAETARGEKRQKRRRIEFSRDSSQAGTQVRHTPSAPNNQRRGGRRGGRKRETEEEDEGRMEDGGHEGRKRRHTEQTKKK